MGKTIFYFGTWMLIAAVSYGVYLYYPLGKAIFEYKKYTVEHQETAEVPVAVPTITKTNSDEYSLTIPKIQAYSKIVENVSPFNAKEYLKVLENNVVAQAKGTAEVGGGNGRSTYIFAHSSQQGIAQVRNNSVFYLLGQLNNSDVIFINRFGTIYTYQVYNQKIINANQIEFLNYSEVDKEVLILQTCWPIGTDWKRLLIFAKRIK